MMASLYQSESSWVWGSLWGLIDRLYSSWVINVCLLTVQAAGRVQTQHFKTRANLAPKSGCRLSRTLHLSSHQPLWHHFGADCHDPMRVFVTHRKRIEQLTVDLIHRGRFEGTETMLIRSQDIRACREPWRGWFL